jgi:hypothetical protein
MKICNNCQLQDLKTYDKECYMFNIFVPEIINNIMAKKQSYDSYKLKFFVKIKEQNEIYENENKIKLPNCECPILKYSKKIKILNSNNPYLIINITWAEEFPNMKDILNMFCLIPMSDKYRHLFSMDNKEYKKNNYLYIKSIILYGIYHYVCVLYINTQKKWAIVDDKTIKYIDKYFNLIDYLLKNHLMPVGLIYSQNKNDKIEDNEIKSNVMTNDDYLKLYKFCQEVENRRELKIKNIAVSKGSFNETNENYLNNNLFYNSIVNLVNSSSDSDYEECKKKIEETKVKKKENDNNNEDNNENKNEDKKKEIKININNNNNLNKDNIKNKNNIFYGRSYMGDFSENNLKGGLIILSTSYADEDEDKDNNKNMDINNIINNDENRKEDEKEIIIGKYYFGKNN